MISKISKICTMILKKSQKSFQKSHNWYINLSKDPKISNNSWKSWKSVKILKSWYKSWNLWRYLKIWKNWNLEKLLANLSKSTPHFIFTHRHTETQLHSPTHTHTHTDTDTHTHIVEKNGLLSNFGCATLLSPGSCIPAKIWCGAPSDRQTWKFY